MKTIGAAKFKEQCLKLLEELDDEGIVITKRGKPVAKVVPVAPQLGDLLGLRPDMLVEPEDDHLSTMSRRGGARGSWQSGQVT